MKTAEAIRLEWEEHIDSVKIKARGAARRQHDACLERMHRKAPALEVLAQTLKAQLGAVGIKVEDQAR